MVIRAGDMEWSVETVRSRAGWTEDDFVDLTFSRRDGARDRVELPWIPRPREMTPRLAHRLFCLASCRRWEDPRTGTTWRARLASREGEGLRIAFAADRDEGGDAEVSTRYPLRRPLGLASSTEMEAMLDAALGVVTGRPH